ncbi:MAG: hypothetical protein JWQ89_2334 [Devosia sp.]|uniref:hypothetical protein n=1 Tax=Devosia sp. TaxID=1871048 RepID=UPI00261D1E0F|nr:hypothetical protein [Devosia sp.]MDB5540607.1 hypothetical protein [Devosia sp.]
MYRRIEAMGLSLIRFPYEDYPPYFDIDVNAGEYAWKPVIVKKEFSKSDTPLVWMDAGDMLRFPILWIRHCLRTVGFYSHRSSGTVEKWTHPGMYTALGLPVGWAGDRKPLNTSCVGFNPANAVARALVDEWFAGAMDKNVIAPEGSSRANHRQDQALMTLLAYRSGIVWKPSGGDRALVTHRDLPE